MLNIFLLITFLRGFPQVFVLYSCGRWTILSSLLAVGWRWASAGVYAFTLDKTPLDGVLLLESHPVTSHQRRLLIGPRMVSGGPWLVQAKVWYRGWDIASSLWIYYHWPPRKCGCCSSYWWILILRRPQFGPDIWWWDGRRRQCQRWLVGVVTSRGRGGGGRVVGALQTQTLRTSVDDQPLSTHSQRG